MNKTVTIKKEVGVKCPTCNKQIYDKREQKKGVKGTFYTVSTESIKTDEYTGNFGFRTFEEVVEFLKEILHEV